MKIKKAFLGVMLGIMSAALVQANPFKLNDSEYCRKTVETASVSCIIQDKEGDSDDEIRSL